MKCSNCGMELDGNFCSNCGEKRSVEIPTLNNPFYVEIGGVSFDVNLIIRVYGFGIRKIGTYSYISQKCGLPQSVIKSEIDYIFEHHLKNGAKASLNDGVRAQMELKVWEHMHKDSFIKIFASSQTEAGQTVKNEVQESSKTTKTHEELLSFKQWKQERKNYTQSHKVKMCLNCGDKLLEKAITCQTCGNKISFQLVDKEDTETINEIIYCAPNPKDELTPKWMKEPAAPLFRSKKENLEPQPVERIRKKSKRELKIQAHNSGQACCPKCGSISLSANKKGFGVIKGGLGAMAGGALTGGIGAVVGLGAGNINAKKVWVTCLNCGKRWKM